MGGLLRSKVAELRAWKANLEALPSCTSSASPLNSATPSLLPPVVSIETLPQQAKGSLAGERHDSHASAPEVANRSSPAQLFSPIRGYTAAALAEAEAAEEMQHGELEVKVGDSSRRCNEVAGACTVVQVRTIDRPGLLAQLYKCMGV